MVSLAIRPAMLEMLMIDPGACFAHQRQGLLTTVEDRIDVDVETPLPVGKVAGFDIACHADPGIVDQHVQSAQMFRAQRQSPLPTANRVGHVMRDSESSAVAHFGVDSGPPFPPRPRR